MADKKHPRDTWDMRPLFALKAHTHGQPFIVVEGMGGSLPVLEDGFLSFELPEDMTPERAEEIVDFLNGSICSVAYTGSPRPEWKDRPGLGAMAREKRKPRLVTTDGAPVNERRGPAEDAACGDVA